MAEFQLKPLKPRGNTGLKTPNPEGFWITPKIRQDRLVRVRFAKGGGTPLTVHTQPKISQRIFGVIQNPSGFGIFRHNYVASRFQGFWLKLSQLGEIAVQSVKLDG